MLRSACALLAVLASLMAWPAYAQDEDTEEGTAAEAADEDTADDASEPADEEEAEAEDEGGGEIDYHRPGPYLGLAGTWGIEKFDDSNDINTEDSVGINARAGYRFLGWLSLEAQGEYLFDFSIDGRNTNADLAIWLVGGNVRLNLPTDLIQPYLLAGGGYMGADFSGDVDETEHGGFARVGGGVEFYPWKHIALDIGLTGVLPVNDAINDLDFISVHWGALYRF
jgi:opacity protein-like surface antigen